MPKKSYPVPSKLPAAIRDEIRRRHTDGESAAAIAKEFRLARTSIYDVIADRPFVRRVSVRLSAEHAEMLDNRCGRLGGEDRQKLVDAVFTIGLDALESDEIET